MERGGPDSGEPCLQNPRRMETLVAAGLSEGEPGARVRPRKIFTQVARARTVRERIQITSKGGGGAQRSC